MLKILARTPARLVLPAVLLAAGTAAASAQQQQPAEQQQQREHVVRRGDTLWDLARTYLSNPFSWPLIWEANRGAVRDPHWIYPAERLIIPPLLQQSAFVRPIGEEVSPTAFAEPIGDAASPAGSDALPVSLPDAGEPSGPTVISTVDLRQPVVSVGEYRRAPWIGARAQGTPGARITRTVDPAAAANRMEAHLLPNDRVYLTAPGVAVGDSLLVVRPGDVVGVWGQVMQPLAILRVDSVWPQQALARVVAQFGNARVGDAVLPLGATPGVPMGQAVDVAPGPSGVLLQFLEDQVLYGTTDLGFVSLGLADGLGIGDELAVYVPAEGAIPETRVAVVRVVRVTDRTATVRVIGATSTAVRGGLPVRLIRKMP